MKKRPKNKNFKPALNWTVRDVIWIDPAPLLASTAVSCTHTFKILKKGQSEVKLFEEECLPAFKAWENQHFSDQLKRMRQSEMRFHELLQIIHEVEKESFLNDVSEHVAYEAIQARKKQDAAFWEEVREYQKENGDKGFGPEFEEFLKGSFESHYFTGGEDDREDFQEDFEEFKSAFQRNYFGHRQEQTQDHEEPTQDEPSREEDEEDFWEQPKQSRPLDRGPLHEERSVNHEVKLLYRELARKLHPDLNGDLTPAERSLWYEVVTAYEAQNTEQLRYLLLHHQGLLAETEEPNFTRIKTLGELVAIGNHLRKKLNSIKRQVSRYRKEPAWNFVAIQESPRGLKDFKRKLSISYNHHENLILERVNELEAMIERWERSSARLSKSRSKKKGQSKDHRISP